MAFRIGREPAHSGLGREPAPDDAARPLDRAGAVLGELRLPAPRRLPRGLPGEFEKPLRLLEEALRLLPGATGGPFDQAHRLIELLPDRRRHDFVAALGTVETRVDGAARG